MKRILSLILVCVLLLAMVPVSVLAEQVQTTPMYRLYNPNSGEHFYTGSLEEKENLVSVGWNYEGIAWNAPIKGGDPVYRLYNPNSGDHHYTMSAEEREMLVSVGWKYEGVCWNSVSSKDSSAIPLFRLYNPNADCGSHHYTTSTEERDNLVAVGWILEGIGWFGAGNHKHEFKDATCTDPKTCKTCGTEKGEALGHNWLAATCTEAKECSVCGVVEGNALGHTYKDGSCTACGQEDPNYVEESYVWIPTKGGTKYHASAECSNMENPEKVTLDKAKEMGFTACKKCYGGVEETITHPIETGTGYAMTVSPDGTELTCYTISTSELMYDLCTTEKPAQGWYKFREHNGTTYYSPSPSWGWIFFSSYTISGRTVQLKVDSETIELELISANQYKVTKGTEELPTGLVFTIEDDMCSFMGHLYTRSCEDDVTCMYCPHVKCAGLGHEYDERGICFRCFSVMRPSN